MKTKTTRDYILVELAKGPKSFQTLQNILGYSYDRLNASLKRLVKSRKVIKINDGLFATNSTANAFSNVPNVVTKPKLNRVILVLDDSGSMSTIASATKKAFDKVLGEIRTNANQYGQETTISFYKFGSIINGPLPLNAPIGSFNDIGYYTPNQSSTRLLDAVGQAISDHRFEVSSDKDISYLLVVITDGLENRSINYSKWNLAELMDSVQKTDRWTLTFQLPYGYKQSFIRDFNIPAGNVMEWQQTDVGVASAGLAAAGGVSSYYNSRSKGATSTRGFYEVNANNISANELNKLEDVGSRCKIWTVESEAQIKPFVEGKMGIGTYTPGSVYYQITKPETLQHYKRMLINKRYTKQVYTGNAARTLLGLPIGVDCKIRPGNLGDYDIFFQSTSLNRILPRGIKVVHFNG